MVQSKLKNSYTIQYEDAKGSTKFWEIQRFLVLKGHHVAVVTNLAVNGSLVSPITSSSELLNNFAESGVLLHHIVVTKRSNISFCIPLCRIKRMCIVVSTSGDNMLTLSTFPNLVEHDWHGSGSEKVSWKLIRLLKSVVASWISYCLFLVLFITLCL